MPNEQDTQSTSHVKAGLASTGSHAARLFLGRDVAAFCSSALQRSPTGLVRPALPSESKWKSEALCRRDRRAFGACSRSVADWSTVADNAALKYVGDTDDLQ